MVARYWCHRCSQMVNPIMEMEQVEQIKCPFCHSGFVEEMSTTAAVPTPPTRNDSRSDSDSDFGSDRALSLWAPILLGMMGNPRRRRRFRRLDFDDYVDDEDDDADDDDGNHEHGNGGGRGDTELDRELDSIIRRRRRSSATILQLLQGIRAGLASEPQNSDTRDIRENRDERERVILINPINQTVIVQNENQTTPMGMGSLGDYFIGPGLDLLLQHLAENDPNRYGTPPAKKEAIEGLPTVSIMEDCVQCSVCLDDFEMGSEAKEMPCKHKFHSACILPWLDLHSSCPVCRFQLPADDSKRDSDGSSSNPSDNNNNIDAGGGGGSSQGGELDGDGRNGSGRRFSFPWPFNGLFSSSGSQSSSGSSSTSTSTVANAGRAGNGTASQTDEN